MDKKHLINCCKLALKKLKQKQNETKKRQNKTKSILQATKKQNKNIFQVCVIFWT